MLIGLIRLEETDYGTKRKARTVIKSIMGRKGSVFHEVLNEAVRSVLYDAKSMCPVETGALRTSIRLMDQSAIPKGSFAVSRDVTVNFMITAGGPPYINPKTRRIVDYAQAVHDGTTTMPARPFLGDAIAKNSVKIDKALDDYMNWTEGEWKDKGVVK